MVARMADINYISFLKYQYLSTTHPISPTIHTSSNINIYQQHIQFPPTRKPDYKKYIQWPDMVNISDTAAITGPINFEPISLTNNKRSKAISNTWNICHETCTQLNMLPPTLRSQTYYQLSTQK